MFKNLLPALAIVLAVCSYANACVSGSCTNGMCSDIPKDNKVKELNTQKFSKQIHPYLIMLYSTISPHSVILLSHVDHSVETAMNITPLIT